MAVYRAFTYSGTVCNRMLRMDSGKDKVFIMNVLRKKIISNIPRIIDFKGMTIEDYIIINTAYAGVILSIAMFLRYG